MKKFLLSSAAVVAFAGAAAAEVEWSGDATLGYNDEVEKGVFWDAGLGVDLSQELNNGWSAAASLDVDLFDTGTAVENGSAGVSGWVVTVENDVVSVSAGDVDTAAESFSFVSEVDADTTASAGGKINDESADYAGENVGVIVTSTIGSIDVAASMQHGTDNQDGAVQLYAGGEFGNITAGLLYASETDTGTSGATTINQDEAILLSAGLAFAGADLTFNAGSVADKARYGVEVSYPVGDITFGAFYTNVDKTNAKAAYGVEAVYEAGALEAKAYYQSVFAVAELGLGVEYDLDNGVEVFAGFVDGDGSSSDYGFYLGGEYDLGGGASVLASYAANDVTGGEFDAVAGGQEDIKDGITLELSLDF